MSFWIVVIGSAFAELFSELWKFDGDYAVDDRVPGVVGRIVRERPQSKSVLVQIGRFLNHDHDEIAATHVVQKVAEIFVAERIVAHGAEGWAAAPAPMVAETKKPVPESRAAADLTVLGKSTEMVQVESAVAPTAPEPAPSSTLDNELSADKREAPGKAKVANGAMAGLVGSESVEVVANQATRSEETVAQKMDRSKLRRSLVSRWTISADGQLQHSIDAGQTWQPVTVAEKASFRALSANGPDIWVGGAAGLLYHSRDSGFTWTQVKPSFAGTNLGADISAIEFTDILHGKITTANGEVWTTEDAGQTWRKQ